MRSLRLSRRSVLRSAAGAVALPPLEAMMTGRGWFLDHAYAAPARPPVRVLTFFFPNGRPGDTRTWIPIKDGADYDLPPCLAPLSAIKNDVQVLTGLDNRAGMMVDGGHEPGCGSFATAIPVEKNGTSWGGYQAAGPSVDQLAAQKTASGTPLPSLAVSMEKPTVPGYLSHVSWAAAAKPVVPERDLKSLFDKLFGIAGVGTPAATATPSYDRSVLDYVRGRIDKLGARLGAADRARLASHLDGVREIERQIRAMPAADCKAPPPRVDSDPAVDFRTRGQMFLQLMAYALKCDLTRFGSFMNGNGISVARPLPGMPNHHHGISHDGPLDWYVKLTAFEVEQFAYFLGLLKAIPEGAGSLLDNTVVFCSSELGDGASHARENVPVLLGGRAGGNLPVGRHLRFARGKNSTSQLFISMLGWAGAPVTSFGIDGKEPLAGLI
jgi:hypothetical protein